MKKVSKLRKVILGGLILAIVGIGFVGCKKVISIEEKNKISDYQKFGEIHNLLLSNAIKNFDVEKYMHDTKEKKVNTILNFNHDYIKSLKDISVEEKQFLNQGFSENRNLIISDSILNKFKPFSLKSESDKNVYELINYCSNKNIFSDKTISFLLDLSKEVQLAFTPKFSDVNFENILNNLNKKFNEGFYSAYPEEENMIGIIISISNSSYSWWKEHPEDRKDGDYNPNGIAPWAAADIGGAIYGAVSGAAGSYVNSGSVSWGSVGWGAVAGAVGGSTGIAGRIGRLFR